MRFLSDELRKKMGGKAIHAFFEGASRIAALHPNARPEKYGITVLKNIDYHGDGAEHHLLDVYQPPEYTPGKLLPVVFYVHGGAFRILSKDTHWSMALSYARRGYVVVTINYGLVPHHTFPANLTDVTTAYRWLTQNAATYGADLDRLVVSGESAGANLSMALLMAATYEREETFAKTVFETGVVPRAMVPMCGIFQVSDPDRFGRRKPHLSAVLRDRIDVTSRTYVGSDVQGSILDFADPLVFFERGEKPTRSLPPTFLSVGTADPLLDDTRRMYKALRGLGVDVDARYYRGGVHSFQAFIFQSLAKEHWKHTHDFLDRVIPR
ncbi:MAG: alpha/beta hydrolase [Polyangiaceae bacterium]